MYAFMYVCVRVFSSPFKCTYINYYIFASLILCSHASPMHDEDINTVVIKGGKEKKKEREKEGNKDAGYE